MADWSTPVLTSTYVTVLDSLKNRDIDAAVQFSPTYATTATHLPTGTIRWNPTNGYWEIRDAGGAWSALQAKYMIDVDKLDGQDGSYYLEWANLAGVPSTFAPSAHTHDDRYYTEAESDARFANKIVTSGNTIKLQTFGNVDLSTITVPYATNAGTVGGFSVGQNLLTTSAVTFDTITLGSTLITATGAEINQLSGVTSGVQTQLNGLQTQINAKANTASPTLTGSVTAPNLRLTDTGDAALASSGHALQIGPTAGVNLIANVNEIMARNNGAATTLVLNGDGGNVTIGNAASNISIPGTLSPTNINLPALAVGTAELNTGAVTTSKLVDGAVTTSKVADGAITYSKLATGVFSTGNASLSPGNIGTYAYLTSNTAGVTFSAGTSYAGSNLRWAGHNGSVGGTAYLQVGGLVGGGTWMCMGYAASDASTRAATLFLRIA